MEGMITDLMALELIRALVHRFGYFLHIQMTQVFSTW